MIWHLFQNASYTHRLTAKTHICVICDIFNTNVNSSLALIKKQGLTDTALSVQIVPFDSEQSEYLQVQWCLETTSSAHSLIIRQGEWHERMKRSEEFTTIWSDFIFELLKGMRKILSYAFKMRQNDLSTRYLDQFISPSFHYAHLGDIFDPSN